VGRIAFETRLGRAGEWAIDDSVERPVHRELSMTLRGLSGLHLTFVPSSSATTASSDQTEHASEEPA
jgi:hypothetical protein